MITTSNIPKENDCNNNRSNIPDDNHLVGNIINDKYKLLNLLGSSFKTYLAIDEKRNQVYAIKIYDKHNSHFTPEYRDRVLQSTYTMMNFNHSAIPKVFDIVEDKDRLCIVREIIQGRTLDEVLRSSGPIEPPKALDYARQLCDVLGYLHKQNPPYIYQDLEPSNIFLLPSADIKLVGFIRANPNIVYDPFNFGYTCIFRVPGYTAPEQFCGLADPRSDIFSLGMILHYLLTGVDQNQPPYEAKPIREINPALPRNLEAIILRCTQKDPSDRFQNCDELMAALEGGPIYPHKKRGFWNRRFHHKWSRPKK